MKTFHCKSVSLFSIGQILNAYILYQSFHLGYIFKTSVAQRARWIITQIVLHFSDKLFKDKVRSFHDTLFPVFESCNNVSKCFMSYYYRPQRSCGQGNVFTGVCLSTGGRVSASVHAVMPYPPSLGPGRPPPGPGRPPRDQADPP